MGNGVKELTIEEYAEILEFLIYENGIMNLRVTENFKVNGKRDYVVEYLRMEMDGDYISCSDDQHVLHKNECVAMAFLKECVLSVKRVYVNYVPHGIIEFIDGTITIERIPEVATN